MTCRKPLIKLSGEATFPWPSSSSALEMLTFQVTVIAQRFDTASNQALLDGLISGSGSVRALIEGDVTLGGACSTCQVTQMTSYGLLTANETDYIGANFQVEVYA